MRETGFQAMVFDPFSRATAVLVVGGRKTDEFEGIRKEGKTWP
ncbi:hypothetical protein LINPERPRIM_LOCUS37138 [Linum perenne]